MLKKCLLIPSGQLETNRETTHLDALQSLGAFRSCWTVKRTLLSREGNTRIMKSEVVPKQICEIGDVIKSYLEVCTALFSANELTRRTLDGQTGR